MVDIDGNAPNKTCVVTGANTGIGKAVALALAQMQHHVVIVSRNPEKGERAVSEIQAAAGHAQVECEIGNLATIAGTHRLADNLLERYPHIGVLINNAGVWMTKRELNEDGLEVTFMVNHLAPFILANRLLPRLQANAPARIVNVNAGLYVKGKVDLEKTPYGEDFGRMGTYANTKLCNVLFTRELARRIQETGVTANAVHPGVIRTGLGDTTGPMGMMLRLIKRQWAAPEEGAVAPVWLATSPEVDGINGAYFELQTVTEVNDVAQDDELARALWDLSAELAGLA